MPAESEILDALRAVRYPGYSRDIVSFGLIKQIASREGAVSVTMQLTSHNPEAAAQIKAESERALRSLGGVKVVHVEVLQQAPPAGPARNPWAQQQRMGGVGRVVAVAS